MQNARVAGASLLLHHRIAWFGVERCRGNDAIRLVLSCFKNDGAALDARRREGVLQAFSRAQWQSTPAL